MHSIRRNGLAAAALTLAAFLTPAQEAGAVDFIVVYDGSDLQGVDPCAPDPDFKVCPNGEPQTAQMVAILQAAADHWSDIIEDDHTILILASWFNPDFGSKPEASIEETDAEGRTTVARIRFGPTLTYFYDPTPSDDSEFNMRSSLFRTLHPVERTDAFSVEPVMAQHDAVEMGSVGAPEGGSLGTDLYTIALHEVGHVIGLSKERDQCNASEPFYATAPEQTDVQFIFNAFAFVNDRNEDASDCNHLALGGITACKPMPSDETLSDDPSTVPGLTIQECTAHQALMWPGLYPGGSRTRPSAIDILAVALAESWEEIDFPRKYSLSSGLWQDASRWFGPRAPDAGDEIFLANSATTTIEVNIDRSARSATISEGNILEVDGANLILSRALRTVRVGSGVGPIVVVPPPPDDPGDVAAPMVPATLRLLDSGGLQAQDVVNLGRIEGNGVVGVTRLFSNLATVRASGGTLRITTPPGGGVVIEPPVVDLDGPDPFDDSPILLARDGNLEINAILNGPFRGRIEVGSGRRLSFSDGFTQAFSSQPGKRIILDNGTIAGILTLAGVIELEGIGEIEGKATLTPGARVLYEAAGQQPGAEADLLFVDGDIALAGTLALTLEDGFEPSLGLVLSMVQASGEITGAFANYDLPDISGKGIAWNVVQNAQNLLLSVIFDPSEVMTDVNGDGAVNFLDLLAILFGFGPCPPAPAACPADLNGDGVVDSKDILFWLAAN